MTKKVKEQKLFRILTNLAVYPMFYVYADDILDATQKAKNITEHYGNQKIVGTVSEVDIPMLQMEDEEDK